MLPHHYPPPLLPCNLLQPSLPAPMTTPSSPLSRPLSTRKKKVPSRKWYFTPPPLPPILRHYHLPKYNIPPFSQEEERRKQAGAKILEEFHNPHLAASPNSVAASESPSAPAAAPQSEQDTEAALRK